MKITGRSFIAVCNWQLCCNYRELGAFFVQ